MDLFDRLHEQIDTVRLPLFAVTVTTAAHINTPLIVLLHWHAGRRVRRRLYSAGETTGGARFIGSAECIVF